MAALTDVATLLADPSGAARLTAEERAGVLCQLAGLLAALGAAVPAAASTYDSAAPYTLLEAATLLHKSPVWLRRKAAAGRIPCARKAGRSWIFPRVAFDRFRERGLVG